MILKMIMRITEKRMKIKMSRYWSTVGGIDGGGVVGEGCRGQAESRCVQVGDVHEGVGDEGRGARGRERFLGEAASQEGRHTQAALEVSALV